MFMVSLSLIHVLLILITYVYTTHTYPIFYCNSESSFLESIP